MSEDDYLLSEILFNPHTAQQLTQICNSLEQLKQIVEERDSNAMKAYLESVRSNLK